MSQNLKRIAIIPDTHAPYHNKKNWALFIKAMKAFKPEILLIGGDFIDCHTVSQHSKNPLRKRLLKSEIVVTNSLLDQLDALGAKQKVFIEGNHEDRLKRYLWDKAPELFGLISIEKLFKLKERGWTHVPYKSDIRIGKVFHTHDVDRAGRDAVFAALALYQHNCVTHHTHRIVYTVQGNARGVPHVSASFGWLGDVNEIDYKHKARAKADYVAGFGIGYILPNGVCHLVPVPIVNTGCVIEGKYIAC